MPQQRSLRMRCRPRRRKVSSRRPLSPVPSRPRLQRSRTRRARTHDSTRRARCAFIARHLPLFGANDVSNIGSEQFDSRTSENRGASSNRDPSANRNTTKPSLDLGHHQNSCRNRRLLQPLCHPRPLQQVRCGMETFTHRIRRVRRDVCHGNNSHARRRFGWLVHSRRPRRSDDVEASLAVSFRHEHHAIAFKAPHQLRQCVLRITIQNFEVRTSVA